MYDDHEVVRLKSIQQKMDTLAKVINRHGGIVKALDDFEGQPAIFMLLVAISEQFAKLNSIDAAILENFDPEDIKGITAVRNFVAHDYDGVNLSIIEDDLRNNMPKIHQTVNEISASAK